MMFHFAKVMANWLEWQKAYRFGVLLVLPPSPVREEINVLRAKYDPRSHAAAEAHISLTVPFPKEPDDALWKELENVACGFAPLTIHYGPLVSFLPKPGVALHIEPQAKLNHLRRALESCEMFRGARERVHPFWAHMTIAEFVMIEDTEELLREIGGDRAPVGTFACDHLSYLLPDEDFRFIEHRTLALRAGGLA
jgi:2'-5' RNA ligase